MSSNQQYRKRPVELLERLADQCCHCNAAPVEGPTSRLAPQEKQTRSQKPNNLAITMNYAPSTQAMGPHTGWSRFHLIIDEDYCLQRSLRSRCHAAYFSPMHPPAP